LQCKNNQQDVFGAFSRGELTQYSERTMVSKLPLAYDIFYERRNVGANKMANGKIFAMQNISGSIGYGKPVLRTGCIFIASLILLSCSPREVSGPGPALPDDQITDIQSSDSGGLIDTDLIRQGYRAHAALAQFYRWFLYFDSASMAPEDHLDILTPKARFLTGRGAGEGRLDYGAQAKNVPAQWQNAHFIRSVVLSFLENDRVKIDADVVFVNHGAVGSNLVHSARLEVKANMDGPDGLITGLEEGASDEQQLAHAVSILPKMSLLEINRRQSGITPKWRGSYEENRLKSLLHYWLYAVENPNREAHTFHPILSEAFRLNFPSGSVTSNAELGKWLAGPASAATSIHYEILDLSYEILGPGQYELDVELDWYGIMDGGEELTGRVNQVMLVEDNFKDPFARIKSIREQEITPGTLRPAEDPA